MKPVESKTRFAIALTEMIAVYVGPLVGTFYLFSRWFLR
jgi:hypothetical protein